MKMKITSEWTENLILECGGFGRYQILLLIVVFFFGKISPTWSVLVMSIAGAIPDWWCNETGLNNATRGNNSEYFEKCSFVNESYCNSIYFDDSMGTVVSEWGLVCDKAWITATITSIQMCGNFISALIVGHISDMFGRKPTVYAAISFLTVFNFIAYFSVSWQMFAILRFFIGFASGNYFAVYFPLMIEFIPVKQRPIVNALPSWTIWAALLGLISWLIPNWANLHLLTAAASFPLLFTWWYVKFLPESFRWLLSKNRTKEAEAVIIKMAKINRKPVPDLSRIEIGEMLEEKTNRFNAKDLFRTWKLARSTLLIFSDYTFYAISFGVQQMSGSIYLNIFLLSMVELPSNLLTYYLSNKLGRKWTCLLCNILSAVASFVVAMADITDIDPNTKRFVINVFALTAKIGNSAAWCVMATLTAETYPTVIRNIGYGFHTTVGKIGSILAPQVVYLNQYVPGLMYFVCGVSMSLSAVCTWLCEETKNKSLQDKIDTKGKNITSEWTEKLILECGGFGRYQIILLIVVIYFGKISPTWSMLVMSIAGAIPDWWCHEKSLNNATSVNSSEFFQKCWLVNESYCKSIYFEDSMGTVISEWDLVCDKAWMAATITSIQMTGYLISGLIVGHISDIIGRKPTIYAAISFLTVFNFLAYFSVSWQMFAILRFFIGFASGNYFAVYFPLMIEFIPVNKDQLFLPESFRWLLLKNRTKEAEAVIIKMAKINRKPVPDLSRIEFEEMLEEKTERFTAKDLFSTWKLARSTFLLSAMIFSGYTFYAISFGVQKMSGSIYLNIFMLSIMEIPGNLLTYYMCNKNIGYGFHTTVSRIGSILAPQVVYLNQYVPGLMYIFCGVSMSLSFVCAWLCEETKNKTLQDKIDRKKKIARKDCNTTKIYNRTIGHSSIIQYNLVIKICRTRIFQNEVKYRQLNCKHFFEKKCEKRVRKKKAALHFMMLTKIGRNVKIMFVLNMNKYVHKKDCKRVIQNMFDCANMFKKASRK
ncbi:LOW QUALITY PROTEIN: hypothetical protein KUTeg_010385 [Tegillarca granosa]|uniref:Major facilitator superfamily (MFS) profile domain-containing protein n=1 Tax=Tegillarca granosa TaxID=220873 RepID=A0ABQ9F6N2_TEGGR|nr:LOW QUALITY PROTEIN: hypothetical protein KUTeg_010385 [Tegillarca granosa]